MRKEEEETENKKKSAPSQAQISLNSKKLWSCWGVRARRPPVLTPAQLGASFHHQQYR